MNITIKTMDELVKMFVSMAKRNSFRNPTFYRHLNNHSEKNQEAIWAEIEAQGYERPARFKKESKPKKDKKGQPASSNRVSWTEQEVHLLASTVWELRKDDAVSSFLQLLAKAQERLRPDRRRNANTAATAKSVIESYQQIEAQVRADAKEAGLLREQLASNSPKALSDEQVLELYGERVLDNVTPDEIVNYAGESLLESLPLPKLAGYAVERLVEHLNEQRENSEFLNEILLEMIHSKPKKEEPRQTPPATNGEVKRRLPRVSILGMLPNQTHKVRTALGDRAEFNFVDKNRKAQLVSGNEEVYVIWARFSSHAMQTQVKKNLPNGTNLIVHHGGVEKMIEELDKVLN